MKPLSLAAGFCFGWALSMLAVRVLLWLATPIPLVGPGYWPGVALLITALLLGFLDHVTAPGGVISR